MAGKILIEKVETPFCCRHRQALKSKDGYPCYSICTAIADTNCLWLCNNSHVFPEHCPLQDDPESQEAQ